MTLAAQVARDLDRTGHISLSGLPLSAAAYLASNLPEPEKLVAIAPDAAFAGALAGDLAFFLPGHEVVTLPAVENNPMERMLPNTETESARMRAFLAISSGAGPVVIPAPALLQPAPPPEALTLAVVSIRVRDELNRDELLGTLLAWGYRRVSVVTQVGEVAVRGGIVDIFSPAHELPCRIELWEDDVQSLRAFDPDLQRSTEILAEFQIIPVSEIIRNTDVTAKGKARLSNALSAALITARERERCLDGWENGTGFPGIHLFMPFIYGDHAAPADYLREDSTVLLVEPGEVTASMKKFYTSAAARAAQGLPNPEEIYRDPEQVIVELTAGRHILTGLAGPPGSTPARCSPPLALGSESGRLESVLDFIRRMGGENGYAIRVAARSESSAQRIAQLLRDQGFEAPVHDSFLSTPLKPGFGIVSGQLSAGFILQDEKFAILSDSDIFGRPKKTRVGRSASPDWDLPVGSLTTGDTVVHIEHGICRFDGLKQLDLAEQFGEYLHLAFSGGDTLYVPVQDMNRVQRYRSAAEKAPPLSRLGTGVWGKAKERARRSLKNMATELIHLSATRKSRPGHAFSPPDFIFREFEASFPWTETPDQEKCISEVLADMMSPKPMDRLVCGDVGYGKTEVALRAAFLTVSGGKQAAVLVPTTVLAQQHFQNFSERLERFPVKVAMMSRFVSGTEAAKTREELAAGKVDIVIGTHRLLSGDVRFSNLGLLVIDEEHRFGVRHKEKLKKIKETVDVLTLSATPIPRTLYQAFSGLRDLSLIHTPPVDRKAVHTEIRYFDEDLIRDAVIREMDRGGQVYIVHNRVLSIHAFSEMVRKLVPEARVGVAHGQMPEKELENIMVLFLRGEYDVLVTTAIIESGLDIPNANTLIVNRADWFGLAQLYQLRGRVGRSSVLAYCYLMVPPTSSLTKKARERLTVLKDLAELGSGFKLASYDMEIRGAGNLLGEEQSGQVASVGLDLFSQLLEQALREASGEESRPAVEPSVNLGLPAILTQEYLPDEGERLTLYKRLAKLSSEEELNALREEALDRFGKFTHEVKALFVQAEVTVLARQLLVEHIDMADPYYVIVLHHEARVSPDALVNLLTADKRVRFIPPTTLRIDVAAMESPEDRVVFLKEILRSLL